MSLGYGLKQKFINSLTKEQLQNKIKGGWAGQTIGVTFGGPYEFRFNGTFIGDYQSLLWYDGYLKKTMVNNPGLYDDLYMDLTFVDVFEKYGINAPVDSFANAFAHADYMLWHANQAARYNILNGIAAPASGHWKNNPHADCIDYQIESDFAGLMSPGMPNTASAISDKIGHIMNYGDGWYGGRSHVFRHRVKWRMWRVWRVWKRRMWTTRRYMCVWAARMPRRMWSSSLRWMPSSVPSKVLEGSPRCESSCE